MTGVMAMFLVPLTVAAAPYSSSYSGSGSPVAAGLAQDNWDVPPAEFDEVTRHGFHDGVEAARSDYKDHKEPDLNRHEKYRHPDLPEKDREAFRRGFERGYRAATDHLWHRG